MKPTTITKELIPTYVQFIPEDLEEGKLYISNEYHVAIHLCACGCKNKTVTPLGADWWTLIIENNNNPNIVSLNPSIGNWKMPCRSHYVIINNVATFCDDSGGSSGN